MKESILLNLLFTFIRVIIRTVTPEFTVYYHRSNNEYCYCLDRKQLGQYWRCVNENHDKLCFRKRTKCLIFKEASGILTSYRKVTFLSKH